MDIQINKNNLPEIKPEHIILIGKTDFMGTPEMEYYIKHPELPELTENDTQHIAITHSQTDSEIITDILYHLEWEKDQI